MKKIKDLTVEEYEKWFTNNCCAKYNCLNCPFSKTICEPYKTNSCWIFNKNLYSNEFLNKEIELDNEILSNNERKFLQAYINLYNDFGKVKKIHIKENESSNNLSKFFIFLINKDPLCCEIWPGIAILIGFLDNSGSIFDFSISRPCLINLKLFKSG